MLDLKFLFEKFVLGQHKYELEVRRVLNTITGDIFVDVGANVGYYTHRLRKQFDRIIAFEPNPEAFRILSHKMSRASHVELYEIALSNQVGEIPLFTNNELVRGKLLTSGASLLQTWVFRPGHTPDGSKDFQRFGKEQVMVKCATYDSLLKGTQVSLAKIDVEGAEFLVLEGMDRSLAGNKLDSILVELHDRTRRPELESILVGYGYRLSWVDPLHCFAEAQELESRRS